MNNVTIGLTGNIATGKSTVLEMLTEQGALGIDADKLVHQIMDGNPEVQTQIIARFGPQVQGPDGTINRSKLGDLVFPNPAAMRDLEAIIHPLVGAEIDKLIAESQAELVVIEAIKLFESKLRDRCHQIWVTHCRPEQQIERLVRLRDLSRHEALVRVLGQAPQEIKLKQADVIIDTSGKFRDTENQVKEKLEALLKTIPQEEKPIEAPVIEAEVEIRRAGPKDVDAMAAFINASQSGDSQIDRVQLLQSFGEHGYMLALVEEEIQAIAGWNTEDFIGRVREFFLQPGPVGSAAGHQLLEAVCQAAYELMCEVALLFHPPDINPEAKNVFQACKFEETPLEELISAWRKSAEQSMPGGSLVMVRKLRDKRVMRPV